MTFATNISASLPTTESSCDTTTILSKTLKKIRMQRKLLGKMEKRKLKSASQRLIVMNKPMSTSSTRKSNKCWSQTANFANELPTSIISRSVRSKLNKTRNKFLLKRSNLVYRRSALNAKAICLPHNSRKQLKLLTS